MSAPLPPSDLDSRDPELLQLPAGTIIHRFYTSGYEPIFFDPGLSGRLNAPDGSYGVLYGAKDRSGAFAETFLRTPGRRLIDTLGSRAAGAPNQNGRIPAPADRSQQVSAFLP